ncbi:hypothetical protein PHMEG_00011555 [Phytophthora megakarya]|uniref:Wiskott-Aldrich syndrome protein family member n=1 Tax=Phytophthora megakarya TaxID=4795 RepID=A0A225WD05_9STRA|nr:hypothetical protein PHMEG_00011555 [Phytophthora megakarya]
MITRAVPSIKGQTDPTGYESTGFQGRARPPEDVLRQARATSITGVLGQIASVASYAFDILQELKDETIQIQDRMRKLHERVDVVAEVVNSQIRQQTRTSEPSLLHLLPSQEESDQVLCVQTISSLSSTATKSKSDRPTAVVEAYERCEGIPPLELLDSYYDAEQRGSGNQLDIESSGSISRKKYSNPGFFMEEWLKNEVERQQRALEIKEERRRERREAQILRKARELDHQRQTTSTEDAQSSTSTEDAEQKLKFLKIRSWREIYGTGEGKELMKPQQSGRSPSLRDLRKKAQQSLASIKQSPTKAEERQQPVAPPPPPSPQDETTPTSHHLTEQFAMSAPPDPPSISTSLGGAFMQEMDDDEMAMELEEEFTNGIPPPPPPDSSPEEFTDHGLSYYYDPTAMHSLAPPPPPPELDEQSKSDAFYDAYEEEEEDIPPPLPLDDFVPPPPESPPASNLLEEIQLGASHLRSVHDRPLRESPARTLSPQAALLQQILQKQSRHLRPVEPRSRPAIQTRHTTAPFADSIARILDRRTMIAYDSDSDSHKSNNDDDW